MSLVNAMPECMVCSTPMGLRFDEKVPVHWACPQCRLECITPQPGDQALAAIYDESYFTHYQNGADAGVVRAMKRATYERQFRRLGAPEESGHRRRLLDCGAATGFLAELAKECGWDAFAIEISEFGARACTNLLGPERVYRGEAYDASFAANPEGRFDAITMFDFIEHVRDPRSVLKWARERLSPGGALLLTTPRVGSISWHVMDRQWFHYTQGHLWFFNPESIRTLLRETGFSAIEVNPLPKAITIGYAIGHYARRTAYSRLFSPTARALDYLLPAWIKRQRFRLYLGEMAVIARA
jgi:2-polyprenyl-3-methyl-5-hydroxy-6-metoxy-1,4-benzoquinol methylase